MSPLQPGFNSLFTAKSSPPPVFVAFFVSWSGHSPWAADFVRPQNWHDNAYYAVRLDVGGVVKLHTLCILEYSALGRRKDLVLGLRGRNRNQTEDAR